MAYEFENLVFEGGGVKGLAFCGALKVLEEKGIMKNIKRLAGSSAGAITAGLLACGYTSDGILEKLRDKNFNDFKDDSWGFIRDLWRLKNKYGFHLGKEFYNWYGALLEDETGKADITFADVFDDCDKELVITGTCLNRRETHYYTKDRNPNMSIRQAVRISMSIPLFFAAVEWKGDLLVDGGVLNNYPLWVFDGKAPGDPRRQEADPNPKTLGLKLLTEEEIAEGGSGQRRENEINDIKDFALSLVESLTSQIERLHIKPHDWERTIAINTRHVKTTDFDMKDTDKKMLLEEGRKGAEKFFAWFDAQKTGVAAPSGKVTLPTGK